MTDNCSSMPSTTPAVACMLASMHQLARPSQTPSYTSSELLFCKTAASCVTQYVCACLRLRGFWGANRRAKACRASQQRARACSTALSARAAAAPMLAPKPKAV